MKVALIALRQETRLTGESESVIALTRLLNSKKGVQADIIKLEDKFLLEYKDSKTGDFFWKNIFKIPRLFLRLKKSDYDILHLFLPTPSFSFLADILHVVTNKKVIVTFEGFVVDSFKMRNFFKDTGFYLIRYLLNNPLIPIFSFHLAKGYIVSSEAQKKQLDKYYYKNKIYIIPNLVDDSRFKRYKDAKKIFKLNKKTITYIGHFFDIKGIDFMLDSFHELMKKDKNYELVLAYSGLGNKNRILRKIRKMNLDDVKILGKVDINQLLSATDIFYCPYNFVFGTNWFPSVILEAFYFNIPVISSDLKAIKEIVPNMERGILIRNKAEFVKAVKLLENDKIRKSIINNQKRFIKEKLNKNNILNEYLKVYDAK